MARLARSDVFDPFEVSVFHCLNRCVRRCFLCGNDPLTGKNFDHRKAWLEKRIRYLARWFGIDVLSFAVLSNHFHVILRNRPDVVATWSDREVAVRWLMICPRRRKHDGEPAEPSEKQISAIVNDPQRIAVLRERLSHISWFMRMISEPIARWANREDEVSGRFWQGRFKAIKLCDEAAILSCSVYVDLNVMRAGLARSLETSDFTSVQRRIQAFREKAEFDSPGRALTTPAFADDWLAPILLEETSESSGPQANQSGARCSDKGFLPLSLPQYLELVDWSGRQVVEGKCGAIPDHLSPILHMLGIDPDGWLKLTTEFGRLFQRVAGSCGSLEHHRCRRTGRRFRSGHSRLLGRQSARAAG